MAQVGRPLRPDLKLERLTGPKDVRTEFTEIPNSQLSPRVLIPSSFLSHQSLTDPASQRLPEYVHPTSSRRQRSP